MTDLDFDVTAPKFDSPTVAKVAGVENQVLLGWRRRHGFLGGSETGSQGNAGYRHSPVEGVVVVAIARMIRRGLDVENALLAENELVIAFTMLLENPEAASTIFGYHAKGRDPKIKASFYYLDRSMTLGEVLDKTPTHSVHLLDLQNILD